MTLTAHQAEFFEGMAKILTAGGAFLSAVAGTYLAVDSVENETSEDFRTFWSWAPLALIIPVGWVLARIWDPDTALNPSFSWGMIVGSAVVFMMVLARVVLFNHKSSSKAVREPGSRKAAWILVVLGFDTLFFGAFIDVITFFFA